MRSFSVRSLHAAATGLILLTGSIAAIALADEVTPSPVYSIPCSLTVDEEWCQQEAPPLATSSPGKKPRIVVNANAVATAAAMCADSGGVRVSAEAYWTRSRSCYTSLIAAPPYTLTQSGVMLQRHGSIEERPFEECMDDLTDYEVFIEVDDRVDDPYRVTYGAARVTLSCCEICR